LHGAAVTGGEERFDIIFLVERPKPMSSAFRRQSRWASSPKSQQRRLLRGERSSTSNLLQGVRKSATQELAVNERLDE
jgi:hypothetical protein